MNAHELASSVPAPAKTSDAAPPPKMYTTEEIAAKQVEWRVQKEEAHRTIRAAARRRAPLGIDRAGAQYWAADSLGGRPDSALVRLPPGDDGEEGVWGMYPNAEAVHTLAAQLKPTGLCEGPLAAALQSVVEAGSAAAAAALAGEQAMQRRRPQADAASTMTELNNEEIQQMLLQTESGLTDDLVDLARGTEARRVAWRKLCGRARPSMRQLTLSTVLLERMLKPLTGAAARAGASAPPPVQSIASLAARAHALRLRVLNTQTPSKRKEGAKDATTAPQPAAKKAKTAAPAPPGAVGYC